MQFPVAARGVCLRNIRHNNEANSLPLTGQAKLDGAITKLPEFAPDWQGKYKALCKLDLPRWGSKRGRQPGLLVCSENWWLSRTWSARIFNLRCLSRLNNKSGCKQEIYVRSPVSHSLLFSLTDRWMQETCERWNNNVRPCLPHLPPRSIWNPLFHTSLISRPPSPHLFLIISRISYFSRPTDVFLHSFLLITLHFNLFFFPPLFPLCLSYLIPFLWIPRPSHSSRSLPFSYHRSSLTCTAVAASEAIKQWEFSTQQMCWMDGRISERGWRWALHGLAFCEEGGLPTPACFQIANAIERCLFRQHPSLKLIFALWIFLGEFI